MIKFIDNNKSARQELGYSIWCECLKKGTLNYIMRFGKTRIIELAVRRNNVSTIILVPTNIAYLNVKHLESSNVEVITLAQLYNKLDTTPCINVGLFIIDEIHAVLTDRAKNAILRVNAEMKLGLTGSTITSIMKTQLNRIDFPVIDTITEQEAVANNWISKSEEYNVPIELSFTEQLQYQKYNEEVYNKSSNFVGSARRLNTILNAPKNKPYFESTFDVIQSCVIGKELVDYIRNSHIPTKRFISAQEICILLANIMGYDEKFEKLPTESRNDYINSIINNWKPKNIEIIAKEYTRAIRFRNDFLKHCKSKINKVIELISYINKPTIIYSDSIEMMEQLYDMISDKHRVDRYHSNIESRPMLDEKGEYITYKSGERKGQIKLFGQETIKKNILERLANDELDILITGRSLSASLNVPNVEFIIITSGDTNINTHEQRAARGKTIDVNNPNKQCTIINLFIDDFSIANRDISSRDKEKLIIRQSNNNAIWLENFSDMLAVLKPNDYLCNVINEANENESE